MKEKLEDKDFLNEEKSFRYQMLDKLKNDCEYFLGMGHRNLKYLHNNDIQEHISLMRKLYYSFDIMEKPEWISLDDILEYENRMLD